MGLLEAQVTKQKLINEGRDISSLDAATADAVFEAAFIGFKQELYGEGQGERAHEVSVDTLANLASKLKGKKRLAKGKKRTAQA